MDAKALLLGSLCLAAPFADAVTLGNALSIYLVVRLGASHTAEDQLHLPLTLKARRSTGECGYTSTLVRYRLLAVHANARTQVLQEGLLGDRYEGARTLALAADAQLAADSTLVVCLGCAVAEWPSTDPARFTMHLLYSSTPGRSNAVDELFAKEYDAARSAGLARSLFCDKELESGRFRTRPEFPTNTQTLYRGWMLTPENYAHLHGAILVTGGRSLTSPQQYRHYYYLSEWYPLYKDLTPAILFLSRNADFKAVLVQSLWHAWLVKDHVESLTTQRGSKATNAVEVQEILDLIERHRDTIEGGVRLREFEALRVETEERYPVLHGHAREHLNTVPPLMEQVIQRIDCPFFSVDMAEPTGGELRLVELGDGQVSNRKRWPATRFAAMLAQVWSKSLQSQPDQTPLDRSREDSPFMQYLDHLLSSEAQERLSVSSPMDISSTLQSSS